MHILSAINIAKSFKKKEAVKGISLELNQGEILLHGTPPEIEQNEIARKVFLGEKFHLR